MDPQYILGIMQDAKAEFDKLQKDKNQLLNRIDQIEQRCIELNGMFMAYQTILEKLKNEKIEEQIEKKDE